MEIKPIKKIKGVRQYGINTDDPMGRPKHKATQVDNMPSSHVSFQNNRLLYDGCDAGQVIRETATTNPQLLSQIAHELEKFRDKCLKKPRWSLFKSKQVYADLSEDDLSLICSLCEAYMARIGELIKQRYDATKDGLSVHFDEAGQFVLNGMNIHAFIENCRNNMNAKSLLFLKGIRNRLNHVLENKVESHNYDRLHEIITLLFDDIDKLLADGKTKGFV